MKATLTIDLRGLDWSIASHSRQFCAACAQPIGEDGPPLMLWKDEGRLMLTLHWECAVKRMGVNEATT